MIPDIDVFAQELTEVVYPSRTYKINFREDFAQVNKFALTGDKALTIASDTPLTGFTIGEDGVVHLTYNAKLSGSELTADEKGILSLSMSVDLTNADRISGYIDGLEAVIQAIYLILSTERYRFIIYSWDYGIELLDLFGKQMPYVTAILPGRIRDALIQDDRITDVADFEFETHGNKLHTTFNVITDLGVISTALEVVV